MQEPSAPRSMGRTLLDTAVKVAQAAGRLVEMESEFAKTEMTQKATVVTKDVLYVAAGGAVAYGGFLVLLAAAVNALAGLLPRWLASLFIGLAVTAAGGALAWRGVEALRQEPLTPQRTLATAQAAADTLKDELR